MFQPSPSNSVNVISDRVRAVIINNSRSHWQVKASWSDRNFSSDMTPKIIRASSCPSGWFLRLSTNSSGDTSIFYQTLLSNLKKKIFLTAKVYHKLLFCIYLFAIYEWFLCNEDLQPVLNNNEGYDILYFRLPMFLKPTFLRILFPFYTSSNFTTRCTSDFLHVFLCLMLSADMFLSLYCPEFLE